MSLKNMTLADPPVVSISGTPALTLGGDGVAVQNGAHYVVKEDTDYMTRRQVTVKHRPPTYDAKTGSYGKDKKSISIAFPKVLDDGKVVFNTIRIERELHPSTGTQTAMDLRSFGAAFLTSEDMDDFWQTGAID